jgi:Protein of unknown function (DUF2474)
MSGSSAEVVSWPRRVGWLVMIWAAGVATLAFVAALFRIVMNLAGLTT